MLTNVMLGPEQLAGGEVGNTGIEDSPGAEGGTEVGVEGEGLDFGGEGSGEDEGLFPPLPPPPPPPPSPFRTQHSGISSISQQTVPPGQDPPPEVQQTPPAGAYVPSLQHAPSRG